MPANCGFSVVAVNAVEPPLPQRVFQRLHDRGYQSGELLAADLAVTRAAIWKAVEQLRELGVGLDALTNKGYRLAAGVSALDARRIDAELSAGVRARLESLDVEWSLESTNTRLLEAIPPAANRAAVVLAEHQWGGRGRRGRSWVAPPGGAICLSLGWQYPDMPADLSALTLVLGLAAVKSLQSLGIQGLRLKWPNDLITAQGKLGGILVEMRAEAGGPVQVVAGFGLNVRLDQAAREAVSATGNTADDIQSRSATTPDRNRIVATLLEHLIPALADFPRAGLTPHLEDWNASDALMGQEVRIENQGEITRGIARGIDAHGALLVETPGEVRRFISGEVTVRSER